jgi:hypothetical protein
VGSWQRRSPVIAPRAEPKLLFEGRNAEGSLWHVGRVRASSWALVVAMVWPFPFTLRLVNFIEGVSNLVERQQVRPTHAAKTFD